MVFVKACSGQKGTLECLVPPQPQFGLGSSRATSIACEELWAPLNWWGGEPVQALHTDCGGREDASALATEAPPEKLLPVPRAKGVNC